ncbi:MAG: UDP-N-acetylmuramoyl-L-alanyl-D-glutamate--2,6-diaminopimelate ligase [Candidatus Moranbacteria bacterium]|nr:UDP-N-acetylmuramoyl-L-alanyl-D-glutamate--2,6-diaminopimelate ligase [Candidatus Moranbacteria bacterium]MDD3964591.1 UDP-N-acetylmuramoyl-L-alanyl-D-glutamate--2,6-diaminopimelate ligase [Candidatus Moranbacteria bacterium]
MKRFLSTVIPQSIKNLYHLMQAMSACLYYGFPGRKIQIIGVTGTNGKTTTTQLIARILEQSGRKVAVASTINFQIGEKKWVNSSKFTTLSAWKLQKFLREAVDISCEYAVIETSSHALDQNRVWGVPYALAVMTNVTREHLDYHKTMAEYRKAKKQLFRIAKRAVVNLDMDEPEYFSTKEKNQTLFYSTKDRNAHLFAERIELDFDNTEFVCDDVHFRIHLPGLFNVENALAALGVARLLDIDFSIAKEALAHVQVIPGRMELVKNTFGIDIIIDYAVTPDSFEKLYESVLPLQIPGTKIIHVFGACGDRDRGKRPIMGEIATSNADIIILTNEDPFSEDPEQILDDIEKGIIKKKEKNYFRIFDRREAIKKSLSLAEIGDIVLITGKGAEETMAIGEERIVWNERQAIEEELKKRI